MVPGQNQLVLLAKTQIKANSYVYEAQNNGRSTATSPTFSTTINALQMINQEHPHGHQKLTLLETWSYLQLPMVTIMNVRQLGRHRQLSIWKTAEGSTITDGTVIWTARKIITWKLVAIKATFKGFSLISN